MKEISVNEIKDQVAKLCMDANYYLNGDIRRCLEKGKIREKDSMAKNVLSILLENADVAQEEDIPICQDTGMTVVFLEVGQEVHITGGGLAEAVNKGVAQGYTTGYLRKSVVADPIHRRNTKDNTPAVIHTEIVPGDKLKIVVAPKGFGSENMSGLKMLKPSQGIAGIKDFVVETVKTAGPNPCPPIIVGVGVGGTMEKAALMAKKALLRAVDEDHSDDYWAAVEQELLKEINGLNIGPGGFGGVTTALGVNIEIYPTHIAGLPVAVNIGCHVTRHAQAIL